MFAKRVKALRSERGFSQEELGKLLGVKKQTVTHWEAGNNYPNFDTLVKMARLFDVSTDYLLGVEIEKIENIARIKLSPQEADAIARYNRMKEAGLTDEKIDEACNFAIALLGTKKPPA